MRTVIRTAVVVAFVATTATTLQATSYAHTHPPHAPWLAQLTRPQRILVRDLRTHYRIGQVSRQVGQLQNSLHQARTYVYSDATRAAAFGALARWGLSGAWPPAQGTIRFDYPADVRITDTGDWWCIRMLEEGGQRAPANEFGFVPYPGPMSAAAQSALAMSILRRYGWGAWTTAPACGLGG